MEDIKKPKSKKVFQQISHSKFITVLVCVVLVLVVLIIANALKIDKVVKEPVSSPNEVAAHIVPAPKAGEKYTDIPKSDKTAQKKFVLAAQKTFSISTDEPMTPSELAKVCAGDATAQITHLARTNEAYQNDNGQILKDVQTVNENCWAKYAETPYVKPPPPQSHINHQTFQHHEE